MKEEIKNVASALADGGIQEQIREIAGGGSSSTLTLTDGLTSTEMVQNDGLQITTTDDKSVIFGQTTQVGEVQLNFGSEEAEFKMVVTDGIIEFGVSATDSTFTVSNGSSDSFAKLYNSADDTDTHLILTQATVEIFKASAAGISTDGSANTWKIGAPAVGATTPDTYIIFTHSNGSQYKVAAELIP